jgi:DNA-binding CsgD family transcriptional regulator/tetratricopeptide (TPR) repeat protein
MYQVGTSNLTTLMDRNHLIDDLVHRLDSASARSVLLTGPAGIGKSHLARRVLTRFAERGCAVRSISGGAAQQSLPFSSLLHLLDPGEPVAGSPLLLTQRLRSLLRPEASSNGKPLIVMVDDADLLDAQSAAVVENAAVHGHIVLVATERRSIGSRTSDHPLTALLANHADHCVVGPLADEEMTAVISEWYGPGERRSVRRLLALSQGVPLLLRAIVSNAEAAGHLATRDGLWFLSDVDLSGATLERLVHDNFERLDDQQWAIVQTLAVAGELPDVLVRRLDDRSLERLQRAKLVVGDPVKLSHPLYGEVIRASMTPDERHQILSKITTLIGPGDDVGLALLGEWLLEIDVPIDPLLARQGAAEGLRLWRTGTARRLLETLRAPTTDDLVQLQWACANDGDLDAAERVSERAVASAVSDYERAGAGLARSELLCFQLGRRTEGLDELQTMRRSLVDLVEAKRVDGAMAMYAHVCGDMALATSAREAAMAGPDSRDIVTVNAMMAAGMIPAFRGQVDGARALLLEGAELAERCGAYPEKVRFEVVLAMAASKTARFDEAIAIIDPALDAAAMSGVGPAHSAWLALAGDVARQRGLVGEAERYFREAVRACEFMDDLAIIESARAELGALLAELGEHDEASRLLFELPADHTGDIRGEGSRARGVVRMAPPAEADAMAVEFATALLGAGHGLWVPNVLFEAVRCGPAPASTAMLDKVAGMVDGPLVAAYRDAAIGRESGDTKLMAAGAARLRELGLRAIALDVEAELIAIMKAAGAASAAARQLALTQDLLASMPDRQRLPVARRVAALGIGVEVLTRRQREIAERVVAGASSREVASDLVVSIRTVDNHLAAIYRKLGVSGRDELAAVLSGG